MSDDRGTSVRLGAGDHVGRHQILSLLGQGGMGEVYAAYDPRLDRRIALKVVAATGSGATMGRLEQEARAIAKVRHANVVTVYDVGALGDGVFIAMEFIDGEPLSSWGRAPRRGTEAIVEAFAQAGDGLAAAHAAGIVHRDFKPANVMVEAGSDRVVVLDFGVARVGRPSTTQRGAVPPQTAENTTLRTVGTPGYMAPEQLDGDPVGVAADQFAFCVSLCELLTGLRPFAGRHLLELRQSIASGPSIDSSTVPARIERLLRVGLHEDPSQRFGSMEQLLEQLRPARSRRGPLVVGIGLAAGLVGVAGWQWTRPPSVAGSECDEAGRAELESTWNEDRKSELATAFVESGRPHGVQTWERVRGRLDAYAGEWIEVRAQACRSAAAASDVTETVVHARVDCLEARRISLEQAVTVLKDAAAEPAVADRALDVARGLLPVRTCGPEFVRAWSSQGRQSEAEAAAGAWAAISAARRRAGQLQLALEASEAAVDEASAFGPSPSLAEAYLERARVRDQAGRYEDAADDYAAGLAVAAQLDRPRLEVLALVHSMRVHGDRLGQFSIARRFHQIAVASARRLAPTDPAHAYLAWHFGTVAWREGELELAEASLREALTKFAAEDDALTRAGVLTELGMVLDGQARRDEAERTLEDAVSIRKEALGDRHPGVADALVDLAVVAAGQGRMGDATRLNEEALAIYETRVDPQHPHVATILHNLGLNWTERGEYARALPAQTRALEIRRHALGQEHPLVAQSLGGRGLTLQQLGKLDAAAADLTEALAILDGADGTDPRQRITVLTNLAGVRAAAGQPDQALVVYEQVLAESQTLHPSGHPGIGVGETNVGDALAQLGRCGDAQPHLERAVKIFEAALGGRHSSLAYPLVALGRCQSLEGRSIEALSNLERASVLREGEDVGPGERGQAQLELAQARHRAGRDDACAAVVRALASLEAAGPGFATTLADARALRSQLAERSDCE